MNSTFVDCTQKQNPTIPRHDFETGRMKIWVTSGFGRKLITERQTYLAELKYKIPLSVAREFRQNMFYRNRLGVLQKSRTLLTMLQLLVRIPTQSSVVETTGRIFIYFKNGTHIHYRKTCISSTRG